VKIHIFPECKPGIDISEKIPVSLALFGHLGSNPSPGVLI